MSRHRTQADIVAEEMTRMPRDLVTKVNVPGVKTLHERSSIEIAEVLTNVLKSRANISEIRYVVGSHIELTVKGE